MKSDIVGHILSLTPMEFGAHDTNYYVSVITEDIRTVYDDYFSCVFDFFQSIMRIVIFSCFMFYLNWIMACVVLGFSVLSILIPRLVGKKLTGLQKLLSEEIARYVGTIEELFGSFSLVNRFTRRALLRRHDDSCRKREETVFRYQKYRSFVEIFAGLSLYLINIATFIAGIILIYTGNLKLGSFVGLLSYIDLVSVPVRDMIYQFIGIHSSLPLRQKLEGILAAPPADAPALPEGGSHRIELQHVSFCREDFALHDISLRLEPGRKYALVGPSGAGKTTILDLILGRLTGYEGQILLDGQDIRSVDISGILADIGQNAVIFHASGLDNVTVFGSYHSPRLEEYITRTDSEGLMREDFGEAGSKLSGGEKNRIALLRALNRECPILIGDEMFAALDQGSRARLDAYLFQEEQRTVLSVTHDITEEALSPYDEIILLDAGQIVRTGAPDRMIPFVRDYFHSRGIAAQA